MFLSSLQLNLLKGLEVSTHVKLLMVQGCKNKVGLRNILCSIQKEQKGWWKRLLKSEEKPAPYLKVDWNKWCDEDEAESSCKFTLQFLVRFYYMKIFNVPNNVYARSFSCEFIIYMEFFLDLTQV